MRRINYIHTLATICCFSLWSLSMSAQGATCVEATQICGSLVPPLPMAITGGGTTTTSDNSNCLLATLNETWFWALTDQPGNISLDVMISPGSDIDFAAWGPFTDPVAGCTMISTANEVSCDFSPANGGTLSVMGAGANEYYLILLSNFGDDMGEISVNATSLDGGIITCDPPECSIVGTPMLDIGACMGMNTTDTTDDIYTVTLTVDFSDASSTAVTLDGAAMTSTNTNTTTGGAVTYTIDLPADGMNNPGVVVIGDGMGTCTIDFTDFLSPMPCSPAGCDADPGTVSITSPNIICSLGQGDDILTVMTNDDFEDMPADPCGLAGTPGVAYLVYTDTPNGGDPCADPNFAGASLGSGPANDPGMLMQNVTFSFDTPPCVPPIGWGEIGGVPNTNINTTFLVCPLYLFDEATLTSAVDYDCGPATALCGPVVGTDCEEFIVLGSVEFSNDVLVCGADPYLGTLTVSVAGGYPGFVAATGNDPLANPVFAVSETTGNGTLASPTMMNGGTITLSDIANGPFEIMVTDANGCSTSFTGVWNQPTISLSADETVICISEPDPTCVFMDTDPIDIAGMITPELGQFVICGNTDGFPGETTWTITNSAGTTVASGGVAAQPVILSGGLDPSETYSITFFDTFGDGWSCVAGGVPDITVTDDAGAGCGGATLFTYVPGSWEGANCGDTNPVNFSNGDGFSFGPFSLGSPTAFISPAGTITGPGTTQTAGTSDAVFDPSAAGVGTHVITLEFTDAQGCMLEEELTLEVIECDCLFQVCDSDVTTAGIITPPTGINAALATLYLLVDPMGTVIQIDDMDAASVDFDISQITTTGLCRVFSVNFDSSDPTSQAFIDGLGVGSTIEDYMADPMGCECIDVSSNFCSLEKIEAPLAPNTMPDCVCSEPGTPAAGGGLTATCATCPSTDCIDAGNFPALTDNGVIWYQEDANGDLMQVGMGSPFDPTTATLAVDLEIGDNTFFAACSCSTAGDASTCESELTPTIFEVAPQPDAPDINSPLTFCQGQTIDPITLVSSLPAGSTFNVRDIAGTLLAGPLTANLVAIFDPNPFLMGGAPGTYQFLISESVPASCTDCESAGALLEIIITAAADPIWDAAIVCCDEAPILLSAGCDADVDPLISNTLGIEFGSGPQADPDACMSGGNVTITSGGDAGAVTNDLPANLFTSTPVDVLFDVNGDAANGTVPPGTTVFAIGGSPLSQLVANAVTTDLTVSLNFEFSGSVNFNEFTIYASDGAGNVIGSPLAMGAGAGGNPTQTVTFNYVTDFGVVIPPPVFTECTDMMGDDCAISGDVSTVCPGGIATAVQPDIILPDIFLIVVDEQFNDNPPSVQSTYVLTVDAVVDEFTPCTPCTETTVACSTSGGGVNFNPTGMWTGDGVFCVNNPDGDPTTDDSYCYFDPAIGGSGGPGIGSPIRDEGEISVLYTVGDVPCEVSHLQDFFVFCEEPVISDDITICCSPSGNFPLTGLIEESLGTMPVNTTNDCSIGAQSVDGAIPLTIGGCSQPLACTGAVSGVMVNVTINGFETIGASWQSEIQVTITDPCGTAILINGGMDLGLPNAPNAGAPINLSFAAGGGCTTPGNYTIFLEDTFNDAGDDFMFDDLIVTVSYICQATVPGGQPDNAVFTILPAGDPGSNTTADFTGNIFGNVLQYDPNQDKPATVTIQYNFGNDLNGDGDFSNDGVCSGTGTVDINILDNFNVTIDAPEVFCSDAGNDLNNFLVVTDSNGDIVDPMNLPAGTMGNWAIVKYTDVSGTILTDNPTDPMDGNPLGNGLGNADTGLLTPGGLYSQGVGTGTVVVSYTLVTENIDGADCIVSDFQVIEIAPPIDFDANCMCTNNDDIAMVDIGPITGGQAPYTVNITGGFENTGLDPDADGSYTVANSGDDGGSMLIFTGGNQWSVTVTDNRGCEVFQSGECERPILDFIGLQTESCESDPTHIIINNTDYSNSVFTEEPTPFTSSMFNDLGNTDPFLLAVDDIVTFEVCPESPCANATGDYISLLFSFGATITSDGDLSPLGVPGDALFILADYDNDGAADGSYSDSPAHAAIFATPPIVLGAPQNPEDGQFGMFTVDEIPVGTCATFSITSVAEVVAPQIGLPNPTVDLSNEFGIAEGTVACLVVDTPAPTWTVTNLCDGSDVTGAFLDTSNPDTIIFDPGAGVFGQFELSMCVEFNEQVAPGMATMAPGTVPANGAFIEDPCYQAVIAADPFCDGAWDGSCQNLLDTGMGGLFGLALPDPSICANSNFDPNDPSTWAEEFQSFQKTCESCEEELFKIFPEFDPSFTVPDLLCEVDTSFTLCPDDITNILATFESLECVFDRPGDVVEANEFIDWSGPGITQLNDGTGCATFNPMAAGAGVHAINLSVGYTTCEASFVSNIDVKPAVNADIEDRTFCASPSQNISLSSLFAANTTAQGGTFSIVPMSMMPPGSFSISGGVLNYINDPDLFPLSVMIQYEVGDITCCDGGCTPDVGDDCYGVDVATVTIIGGNEAFLDLPEDDFCSDEDKVELFKHTSIASVDLTGLTVDMDGVLEPGEVAFSVVAVNGSNAASALFVDVDGDGVFTPGIDFDYTGVIDFSMCAAGDDPANGPSTKPFDPMCAMLNFAGIPKEVTLTIRLEYFNGTDTDGDGTVSPLEGCLSLAEDNIWVKPSGNATLVEDAVCMGTGTCGGPNSINLSSLYVPGVTTSCGSFSISCPDDPRLGQGADPNDTNGNGVFDVDDANYPCYDYSHLIVGLNPHIATKLYVSYTTGDPACFVDTQTSVVELCPQQTGFGIVDEIIECTEGQPLNLDFIAFDAMTTPGGTWFGPYMISSVPTDFSTETPVAMPSMIDVLTIPVGQPTTFVYLLEGTGSCAGICPATTSLLTITVNEDLTQAERCHFFGNGEDFGDGAGAVAQLEDGYCSTDVDETALLLRRVCPETIVVGDVEASGGCDVNTNFVQDFYDIDGDGSADIFNNIELTMTVAAQGTVFPNATINDEWFIQLIYFNQDDDAIDPGTPTGPGLPGPDISPTDCATGDIDDPTDLDGGDHAGFIFSGSGLPFHSANIPGAGDYIILNNDCPTDNSGMTNPSACGNIMPSLIRAGELATAYNPFVSNGGAPMTLATLGTPDCTGGPTPDDYFILEFSATDIYALYDDGDDSNGDGKKDFLAAFFGNNCNGASEFVWAFGAMTNPEETDIHMVMSGMEIYNYKEDVAAINANYQCNGVCDEPQDLGFTLSWVDQLCEDPDSPVDPSTLPAWVTPEMLMDVITIEVEAGSNPGFNDCYDVLLDLSQLVPPACDLTTYEWEICHEIEVCELGCEVNDNIAATVPWVPEFNGGNGVIAISPDGTEIFVEGHFEFDPTVGPPYPLTTFCWTPTVDTRISFLWDASNLDLNPPVPPSQDVTSGYILGGQQVVLASSNTFPNQAPAAVNIPAGTEFCFYADGGPANYTFGINVIDIFADESLVVENPAVYTYCKTFTTEREHVPNSEVACEADFDNFLQLGCIDSGKLYFDECKLYNFFEPFTITNDLGFPSDGDTDPGDDIICDVFGCDQTAPSDPDAALGFWSIPQPFMDYVVQNGSEFAVLPGIWDAYEAGELGDGTPYNVDFTPEEFPSFNDFGLDNPNCDYPTSENSDKQLIIPVEYKLKACKDCESEKLYRYLHITRTPEVELAINDSPGICTAEKTVICLEEDCEFPNCTFDLILTNESRVELVAADGVLDNMITGIPALPNDCDPDNCAGLAPALAPGIMLIEDCGNGNPGIEIDWALLTSSGFLTEELFGDFNLELIVYCGVGECDADGDGVVESAYCSAADDQDLFFLGEADAEIMDYSACQVDVNLTNHFIAGPDGTTTGGNFYIYDGDKADITINDTNGDGVISGDEVDITNGFTAASITLITGDVHTFVATFPTQDYVILYAVGATTSCQSYGCGILTITPSDGNIAAWAFATNPICNDDGIIDLDALLLPGAVPNGIFTGIGVGFDPGPDGVLEDDPFTILDESADNGAHPDYVFDPSTVEFNGEKSIAITICYDVSEGDGCEASQCNTLTIFNDATIASDFANNATTLECQDPNNGNGFIDIFDLSALLTPDSDQDGEWTIVTAPAPGPNGSGPAIFNGQLTGLPGCYELSYTVSCFEGADGACADTQTFWLRLAEQADPAFDLAEEVCWDGVAGSLTLSTLYNGATFGTNGTIVDSWTVTTVSGAGPVPTFSDAMAQEPSITIQGAGVFEICLTEEVTYPACGPMPAFDDDDCEVTVCHILDVTDTANEIIADWDPFGPVCADSPIVDLDQLVNGDINGVFSGAGVSTAPSGHPDYEFDPSAIEFNGEEFLDVAICYTVGNDTDNSDGSAGNFRVRTPTISDGAATWDFPTAGIQAGDQSIFFDPGSGDLIFSQGWFFALNGGLSQPLPSPNPADFTTTANSVTAIIRNIGGVAGLDAIFSISITENGPLDVEVAQILQVQNGTASPVDVSLFHYLDIDKSGTANSGEIFLEDQCNFITQITDTDLPNQPCFYSVNGAASWQVTAFPTLRNALNAGLTNLNNTGLPLNGDHTQAYEFSSTINPGESAAGQTLINTTNPPEPATLDPSTGQCGFPSIDMPTVMGNGSGSGCDAVECHNIRVYAPVDATLEDLAFDCTIAPSGNISLDALFTDDTTPGGTFSGDGVVGNTLQYNEAGCYQITYTVAPFDGATGACMATATAYILIPEEPQPSFDIQDQVCYSAGDDPLTHVFSPLVNSPSYDSDPANVVTTWAITSGPATVAANGDVTVTGTGVVEVCMTETITTPGCPGLDDVICEETFCVQIQVNDGTAQDASFMIADQDLCPGATVTLTPAVDGGLFTGPGVMDDGLGTGATVVVPDNCEDVEVTYTLNDPNGCTSSFTATIFADRIDPTFITEPADETVECGPDNAMQLADWLAINAGAVPDDNCDWAISSELVNTISGCGGTSESVYAFTVTDACENTVTALASFIIEDTTDPEIATIADLTLDCTNISETTDPTLLIEDWLNTNFAASDICGDVTVDHDYNPATLNICMASTTTVTWTATDECGLTNTATADLIIIPDSEAPTFDFAPADLTLDCGDISETTAVTISGWLDSAMASDNCDSDVVLTHDYTETSLDVCAGGSVVVTWTAVDACNNATTHQATLTVTPDTEAPSLSVPAPITLDCTTISETSSPAAIIDAWLAEASATDVCDTDVVLTHDFDGTTLDVCAGVLTTIRVTWTATDACNNATVLSSTITVDPDTEAPTFDFAPTDLTLDCGDISETTTVTISGWLDSAMASDDCDSDVVLTHDYTETSLDVCAGGSVLVTWTAVDACDNATTHQATLTVTPDTEAPVFTFGPANLTLDCGDINETTALTISGWLDSARAEDVCDTDVSLTHNFTEESLNVCTAAGSPFTVTWTAIDACGNTATHTAILTITPDTAPPMLTVPDPIEITCAGISSTDDPAALVAAFLTTATATDICDTDPVLTHDYDGSLIDVCVGEVITVNFTATDACGNATTLASTITITPDVTAPDLPMPLNQLGGTDFFTCEGDITFNHPLPTDECDIVIYTFTVTDPDGTQNGPFDLLQILSTGNFGVEYGFQEGISEVSYYVEDACGNSSTDSFTVGIGDEITPYFADCPPMIMVGNDPDQCSAFVNWDVPIAFDNCDNPDGNGAAQDEITVTQISGPLPGTELEIGTHTVVYQAVDDDGNSATCEFDVIVKDTECPEFITTLPGDQTVECDAVPVAFEVIPQWHTSDNCTDAPDVIVEFVEVRTDGNCEFNYELKRTWTITDEAGNSCSHNQKIVVTDTTAPVLTIPQDATIESCPVAFDTVQVPKVIVVDTVEQLLQIGDDWVLTQVVEKLDTFDLVITPIFIDPTDGFEATATDNCSAEDDIVITVREETEFICKGIKSAIVLRIYEAIDQCGNIARDTQTVEVLDPNPPVLSVLEEVTVSLGADGKVDLQRDDVVVSLFDACFGDDSELTVEIVPNFFNCSDIGQHTVLVGATDPCNNMTAYEEVIVNIVDIIAPSITCPSGGPIDINIDATNCDGTFGRILDIVDGNDCDVTIFTDPPLDAGIDVTTDEITVYAVDASGNASSCVVDVNITITNPIDFDVTLSCNDQINVSLNGECWLELEPDMLLEGDPQVCTELLCIEVSDSEGNDHLNFFDETDIGEVFTARVVDCNGSGNSCWVEVRLEEKQIPQIVFPADTSLLCVEPTDTSYFKLDVPQILNCEPVISLEFEDEYVEFDRCSNPRATITRKWTVTDDEGNSEEAIQTINILPFANEHVIFPEDITVEDPIDCRLVTETIDDIENNVLDPTSKLHPDSTGLPNIFGLPLETNSGLCLFSMGYEDRVLEICAGSYQILRKWEINDVCSPFAEGVNPVSHTQVITVFDDRGPVLEEEFVPVNDTLSFEPWTCTFNGLLPVPGGDIETCGDIFFSAYVTGGGFIETSGTVQGGDLEIMASDFQEGDHWVTYVYEDGCNNISLYKFVVTIVDQVAPVAVCQNDINVSVSTDGLASISASDIDAGSSDAGCGPVTTCIVRQIDFDAGFIGIIDGYKAYVAANSCQIDGEFRDTTFDDKFEEILNIDIIPFVLCKEELKICCDDLGIQSIVLDVTDNVGLSSTCHAEINIEDKSADVLVCAPHEISCTADQNTDLLPAAGISTICGDELPLLFTDTNEFIDDCGDGQIFRIWYLDDNDNGELDEGETSCNQLVTVTNPTQFDPFTIKWPKHYTGEVLPGTNIECDPDDEIVEQDINVSMGDVFSCAATDPGDVPLWCNTSCGLVGMSAEIDTVTAGDACLKLVKRWTVIDWCYWEANGGSPGDDSNDTDNDVFEPVEDWAQGVCDSCPESVSDDPVYFRYVDVDIDGYYTFDQVIQVVDDTAPTVTADDVLVSTSGGASSKDDDTPCTGTGIVTATASDACGDDNITGELLSWTISYNNGVSTTVTTAEGTEVSIDTEAGSPGDEHTVSFTVTDGCGNSSSTSSSITFGDDKNPVPLCIAGVTTAFIAETGTVDVWAADFDLGSFDNCTDVSFTAIRSGGDPDSAQANITFACEDLESFYELDIWVTDENGNRDFCTVSVLVSGSCDFEPGSSAIIAGRLFTEEGEMVDQAEVTIQSPSLSEYPISMITSQNGEYAFPSNPVLSDYSVNVLRDGDYLNGVTTADLIAIQRHIVGQRVFDSPYKVIAADVNNDERVSVLDVVVLRNVILGISRRFANNTSWRFVDEKQEFADILQPWPFTEVLAYDMLTTDHTDENFIAVKIGDLNTSVAANSAAIESLTRSNRQLDFAIQDLDVEKDELIRIDISANEVNQLTGFQFTLEHPGLAYKGIESGEIDMSDFNVGVHKQAITASWESLEVVETEGTLFTIVFEAVTPVRLSDELNITSRITKAEVYTTETDIYDLGLNVDQGSSSITLEQNDPNPFAEQTEITFSLPKADAAVLTIFNVDGKTLKQIKGDFAKGTNKVLLKRDDLDVSSGVLYYQLKVDDVVITKKMIAIQ